ncbi:MAG: hypothetical protein LBK60_11470 [Verrucomicrobiales bacterium]|nr:hypothetical protein [Verrucomicrobiales bacterium]
MKYYLDTYLNGMDQFAAYDFIGMDPVIYASPTPKFSEHDLKNWVEDTKELGTDDKGDTHFITVFHTPEGDLTVKGAYSRFSRWETEHMIKTDADFELYRKYYPVPVGADWSEVIAARDRVGDRGIVRTFTRQYGQPGTWQSLTCLVGVQEAIMKTFDDPEWVHYALQTITDKSVKGIEGMGKIETDLVENGGGAASSTVISPTLHQEFCLPYDQQVHRAIHAQGALVVYHLCGGLMPLLELVTQNGADALETMTPSSMGGDCRMEEAAERVGDKLAFVGGFDQNEGFERGNLEFLRREVHRLFAAKPRGGFIISPSDHFFFGNPDTLKEFVKVCRECVY